MTIYEIYVDGVFHEAWDNIVDAYARAANLRTVFSDMSVFMQSAWIDFQGATGEH